MTLLVAVSNDAMALFDILNLSPATSICGYVVLTVATLDDRATVTRLFGNQSVFILKKLDPDADGNSL